MIQFQNDYVDRLNRQYNKGKFIKAVIVTTNPTVIPATKEYWADHEDAIVFNGNTYQPLAMHWGQIKTTTTMSMQGAEVALSNIGGQVVEYLKTTDITGNEVIMQLLHLDLLATLTNHWQRKLKVLAVRADVNVAVFTLGRELGRNRLPRRLILPEEQG